MTPARSLALQVALLSAAVGCGGDGAPASAAQGGASGAGVSTAGSTSNQAGMAGGGAPAAGGGSGGAAAGTTAAAGTAGDGSPGGSGGAASAGAGAGGDGVAGSGGASEPYEPIVFGTKLNPAEQVVESRQLAGSLANPASPTWRAKGDQKRTYRLPGANQDVPYRVCVPSSWDGATTLPLVMFLHGANNDESSYLDQNGKQMVKLAEQHGYVLVSPLGYEGAYGTFLRLPADFSRPEEAAPLLAKRTPQDEARQELSEKDVINVLELVLAEYPIDKSRMFLTGHSMGSGGTWYIGGKYASYWAALAPMSGPFVLEHGYPWENLRGKPVFVTEGLSAATVAGSRAVRDWMEQQGFAVSFKEVNADHAGMVPVVLPDVFKFFDEVP